MKNAILVENGFFDMSLWQTLLVCGIVVIVGILYQKYSGITNRVLI